MLHLWQQRPLQLMAAYLVLLSAAPPGPASTTKPGRDHPVGVARQASEVSVSSTTANMADPGVIKPHVWQLAYQAMTTFVQPVSGLAC